MDSDDYYDHHDNDHHDYSHHDNDHHDYGHHDNDHHDYGHHDNDHHDYDHHDHKHDHKHHDHDQEHHDNDHDQEHHDNDHDQKHHDNDHHDHEHHDHNVPTVEVVDWLNQDMRWGGGSGTWSGGSTLKFQWVENIQAYFNGVTSKQWIAVGVLCFINLINYMDRFTVAGVLTDIEDSFHIKDDKAGLLQTAFIVSYMTFAPVFGYLGDRHNRKSIIAAGVLLWSLTTFLGSFMKDYYSFLVFRALVGIGEASYSTVAPTIISDLFDGMMRSTMLALFYFAVPCGSGIGYIIGGTMRDALGGWQWALRVTPALGLCAVALIAIFLKEPVRGQSEGLSTCGSTNSWSSDLKLLLKNKSFMLSTAGFTCVAFTTGALAWFGPLFLKSGFTLVDGHADISEATINNTFGTVSMFSGILGVPLGSLLVQILRHKYASVDPQVCGFGLLLSAPFIYMTLLTADIDMNWCYIAIFIGEMSLNLTWSIVADIILYVVPPKRRATAQAVQISISHALGDAGGPYFIGVMSELIKNELQPWSRTVPPRRNYSRTVTFHGLQYALFITCFIEILGAVFFILTSLFIIEDREKARESILERERTSLP